MTLREAMDEKGIKSTTLAQKLGVSSGSVSRWRNYMRPAEEYQQKLDEFFGTKLDYDPESANKARDEWREGIAGSKKEKDMRVIREIVARIGVDEALDRLLLRKNS